MKERKVSPTCIECLRKMTRDMAEMAVPGDKGTLSRAEAAAERILQEAVKSGDWCPPRIANRILRELRDYTGVEDPYAAFKSLEMARARETIAVLEGRTGSDFRSLVCLSLLGNSLDFFYGPDTAFAGIPEDPGSISCYYDDIGRLESFLSSRPERVLFLTDNAGEIFFDLPLYDYIREHAGETLLLVKGEPSLNDLTRTELRHAGLEGRFDKVMDTGIDGVGIDWECLPGKVLELFDSADLVISKGMANFETLYPRLLSTPIFFLFKVKCEPIQDYIGAPKGSYLAFWRDGIPSVR
ncbi:MAG: DUF89 family protein [Deltaproteobacteria bacterium]|nr:DUF89 family protein [Deltaproteobacteria bacterium]MBW2017263.1 DUF89 family protein [Deltaproteobacteria bacterium]MBW2128259.1 DUF89 family protein [Deltaproteobacteria bacterium]MBW2302254.1 DUF89 family protein [Deltaproteobacteria bacterium]